MNTSHYPSIELCKKLTDIGFPETEKVYCSIFKIGDDLIPFPTGEFTIADEKYNVGYVCPSVMEMLDVMPDSIPGRIAAYCLTMNKDNVSYDYDTYTTLNSENGLLPNALAEMILWLHEHNYITFSKG